MTANEKRLAVIKMYNTILGRNYYSQPKRNYCFTKYTDGKYYSDCSSSISYCYRKAGYDFGILNTVGMYQSTKMTDVPVQIKNGKIQNPEVLRVGDMLLFAGTDVSRASAGYVGHVEMVHTINGNTVTICGHGSGKPSKKNMNDYCKTRYNMKSKTKLGNCGLIRVRRFIQDDAIQQKPESNIESTGGNGKMKYNKNNKPLVCMQTTNRCYKNTRTMTVKGVLWHSTAANNPYLKRYVQPSDNASDREYWLKLLGKNQYNNDWNHTDRQAGMNCWIGKLADGTITTIQTMPWNYRPWGCGSGKKGSCNSGWIQFEICEAALDNKEYFEAVYREACEITAYLCDMYNLDPHGTATLNGVKVPVILCHKDSYNLGLGNNHSDIYHWFKKHGKDMDDVRNDVAAIMKSSSSKPTTTPSTPTTSTTPSTSTFKSYKVKVTASVLNIRAGASTKYDIVGELKKGDIVTVIDKNGNWEKTSKGWIHSDYTKEVTDTPSTSTSKPTTNTSSTTFVPYKVKVTADVLNIRKGAGTNYDKNGSIKKNGVYTIVEEATGKGATKWGLLKSYQTNRNGWIALDYTKRV